MNIKIICIGKVKESYITDGIQEYQKRISKYANFEIIELSDEIIPENPSQKQIEIIQRKESEKIQKYIKQSDFVCALDLIGKQFTSEELSQKLQDITINGFSTIDFIIGGTVGLDRSLVTNSNLVLSFSKLTFPHQLIRLFLTEQLFRCFKIMNNERYHW